MEIPSVISRRLGISTLLLYAFTAGCQEEPALTLPSGAETKNSLSARVFNLTPCTHLEETDKLVKEMVRAVNAERAKHNLKPLKLNPTLMQVADFYACRLVDGHFFSHRDPYDGSTVATRAVDFGYAFSKVGENLAAEQRTVASALKDLLDSELHRSNILDPAFTEIGVSVKTGGDYGIYWVQEFGRPITEEAFVSADLRMLDHDTAPDEEMGSPATSAPVPAP